MSLVFQTMRENFVTIGIIDVTTARFWPINDYRLSLIKPDSLQIVETFMPICIHILSLGDIEYMRN